ncbi:phage neck terminator protein [Alicyclobacillus sendaiensis]|uniref:phage neck terminator protein n=1 Tax=Alicyclobacillus sendaiensis TaxID=192387 RepID=UPI000783D822|nr:hypothetical protein [Alicyclobacillus sendaiensis]
MADTVLSLEQLEDFFQSWTGQALGTTDPSAVRIGWPTDGSPGWQVADDVCFLMVQYTDNSYTRQIQTEYDPLDAANAQVSQVYTVGIRATWTFYGPNAWSNADLVRASLYRDATTQMLAANNLSLIPDVPMPVRVPELFNGQWWNRVTFFADFYELVIRQTSVPYIAEVDVTVASEDESEGVQIIEG